MRPLASLVFLLAVVVAVVVTAGHAGRAAADPAPMAAGAVPTPTTSTEIALVREDLAIEVAGDAADVRAELLLENRGPDTKLTVGFPCDPSREPGMAGLDCRTRLDVRVGGKRTAARLERTGDGGRHWVWPMRLAAAEKLPLTVSYRMRLRNDRYTRPFFGMGTLYYRLATGARWAGPIGELHIRVDMPTDLLVHIAPGGYRREHGRVSWDLEGYEPTEDLAILIHPMYLGPYAAAIKAESRAALVAALAAGRVDRAALARVAAEMRRRPGELVEYARTFHEAARARLGLPEPKDDEVRACVAESLRLVDESAAERAPAP